MRFLEFLTLGGFNRLFKRTTFEALREGESSLKSKNASASGCLVNEFKDCSKRDTDYAQATSTANASSKTVQLNDFVPSHFPQIRWFKRFRYFDGILTYPMKSDKPGWETDRIRVLFPKILEKSYRKSLNITK